MCSTKTENSPSAMRRAAISARMQTLLSCVVSIPFLSFVSESAIAQSASPGSAITLDPIVVEAQRQQTAPASGQRSAQTIGQATATVQKRFNVLPGGVALVPQQEFPDTANLTVSKALSSVPGVVVQDFFGGNDQPRIQIRGSGLQQNPVERGIFMLQNGLPMNRVDGSYIVGFASPRQAESIEVYRGYMANRLGATVLGGALNFVSPNGSTQPGAQIMGSGGSFGQGGLAGQAGFKKGNVDGLIEFDDSRRDGFRDYHGAG